MKPKPFVPHGYNGDKNYVRDSTTDLVWHRVFNRPLYADTDRSEVIYHANYLRYFELGRTSLMRDVGYPYRAVEDSGFVYPVVEIGINYYKPLYYDDPMWVHTRPANLERVRIRFDYLITHAESGEIVCKGFTTHCSMKRTGRPTQVDERTARVWKSFPS